MSIVATLYRLHLPTNPFRPDFDGNWTEASIADPKATIKVKITGSEGLRHDDNRLQIPL